MEEAKVGSMAGLSDPLGDRQVKEVRPPAHRPLSEQLLFGPSKIKLRF